MFDSKWNNSYLTGETPWDSGRHSQELARVLQERQIPAGRACELGCGTGTNALWLAQQGFEVHAVDGAAAAIEQARKRAAETGVTVTFEVADVTNYGQGFPPFPFLFDRGCYHVCRKTDLEGYLTTLQNLSGPGTLMLCLAGSTRETENEFIPKVEENDIRKELGSDFEILEIREFRFENHGGIPGPLGWSALLQRRG